MRDTGDKFFLDTETYSEAPIKAGTYRYAEHPSTEVMLVSYGRGDDEIQTWDVTAGGGMPSELEDNLADERVILVAHEAMFDRTLLRLALGREVPLERWWCTAAHARAHSLPGGLGKLCDILRVPMADSKMPNSKWLLQLFCKPQKGHKRCDGLTHPKEWAQFIDYCTLDTVAMREVYRRLPQWNYNGGERGYHGRAMWHMDQRANDRGFAVDMKLASGAVQTVARVRAQLDKRTQELTAGEVQKATQRDALLAHLLAEFGVSLPDMKAATIERRLEDENLPDDVKELLAIRLQASTASVAKYNAILRMATADQRMHGTMLYCGAARTGRRSHRGVQPGNLSRVPKFFPGSEVKAKDEYDFIAEMMRENCLDLLVANPLETMGYMVRGAIVAAPGKKLNIADLSNIEGRMMALLAREEWKLKAFAEYDADPDNMQKDLYVLSYAKAFFADPAVVAADAEAGGIMRQVGKVQELSCQYWGALNAFKKMATIYGVELSDDRIREVVKAWREANRATMNFGGDLERAARQAISNPYTTFVVGSISLRRDGAWLRIRLPSGRCLCYPQPEIDEGGVISYAGINNYTRKWQRITTYGGKLAENVVQAASADYMMENEYELIEPAGYDIVLDVHDEVVTETPDTEEFSGKRLGELLATPRPWSIGMPARAGGFSTQRYRKA